MDHEYLEETRAESAAERGRVIAFSKAGKMPCRSWSLPALETCPGAYAADGEIVPVCRGCYARSGNYRRPNVRAVRDHNREDWKREDWVADMVKGIGKEPHFRWFDSGDVYHPKLARKIELVIEGTPATDHWLPTRSHKLPRILRILERIKLLPNAMVRYSSDSIMGEWQSEHGSTVAPGWMAYGLKAHARVCGAYKRDGKCGPCRLCWDKSVPLIVYPHHGKPMVREYRKLLLVETED